MVVKKSNGKVYGAGLTPTEQKALEMEARRQLAEYTRKHDLEIEAIVIRQLRRLTGWGETRLRRFYNGFDGELTNLILRYELGDDDAQWLCTRELKQEGFDIEQWHRERFPNEKQENVCK
jgi:hypothetical protein